MAAAEVFKIASLLLQYPDDRLIEARETLGHDVERLGGARSARRLREAWSRWSAIDAQTLRKQYVETFDFNRHNSLYLTYHSHGDRRERGMALIALKQRYEAAGHALETNELPDYLPLMLEFVSLAPRDGAAALGEHREALELLRDNLAAEDSLWELPIAAATAALPRMTRQQKARLERMAAEGPPDEQVGLEPFAPPEVMPPSAYEPGVTLPSRPPGPPR
jgi:nitrate reductase delta subunit